MLGHRRGAADQGQLVAGDRAHCGRRNRETARQKPGNWTAPAGPFLATAHGMRPFATVAGARSQPGSPEVVAIHLWSVHGGLRHGRSNPRRGASRKPKTPPRIVKVRFAPET